MGNLGGHKEAVGGDGHAVRLVVVFDFHLDIFDLSSGFKSQFD